MTNSQSPQTELADGIFSDEALMQAELHRLYNFIDDDSRQFTRWQMGVAMLHGYNLASRPSPLVDTAEALRALLDAKIQRCREAVSECSNWSPAQAEWSRARDQLLDLKDEIDVVLAAHPKPEEG